jgi:hypothetical protein
MTKNPPPVFSDDYLATHSIVKSAVEVGNSSSDPGEQLHRKKLPKRAPSPPEQPEMILADEAPFP